MLICIVCRDILPNHVPASAHRAVVVARSQKIFTVPFLQMGNSFLCTLLLLPLIILDILLTKYFGGYLINMCRINQVNIYSTTTVPPLPSSASTTPSGLHTTARSPPCSTNSTAACILGPILPGGNCPSAR